MTIETKPIHPGEVLLEVYMKPATPPLTVEMLAQTLRVPMACVTELIGGRRAVTPSMALRLGVICRTTAEYWLGLQRTYEAQAGKQLDSREQGRKRSRYRHSAAAA
jgi:antitoxin HigA-1